MPELPEIETICQTLNCNITNKVIKDLVIRQHSLRWPIPQDLSDLIKNCIIDKIERRGKYLILWCNSKKAKPLGSIIIHLGMSGRLTCSTSDLPIKPHDHVDFIFNDNLVLRYNDPRRFGSILWAIDPWKHKLLANLGPEPFSSEASPMYLINRAKTYKNCSIKQFIMNNKIIVGVGNIYANEALFAAKIHPLSLAKNLTLIHMKQLLKSIRKILALAIDRGGTTLKDFLGPNGEMGKFVNDLKVYGKNNFPCTRCRTPIIQVCIAQRSTFYCPDCQKIL